MAIKKFINFKFVFVGDGSSQAVSVNLLSILAHLTDPVTGTAINAPDPLPSFTPAAVTADNSQTVSSSSISADGILTVNFSTTPGNNVDVTVSGQLQF